MVFQQPISPLAVTAMILSSGADITTLFRTRDTLIYLPTTTTRSGNFCGSTHYLGVHLVGRITFCGMRKTNFLVLLQKSHQE